MFRAHIGPMDGGWDTLFWATQLFGAAAVIIQNSATFLPCGRRILKIQFVSTLLWCFYYGLLGMHNVVLICLASALRIIVSVKCGDKTLKTYSSFHTFLLCLALIFMAQNMVQLFPVLIAIAAHYRILARDRLPQFLYISMLTAVMWGGYSLYNGAWFGLLNDSIAFVCASSALLRYYQRQKKTSLAPVVPA